MQQEQENTQSNNYNSFHSGKHRNRRYQIPHIKLQYKYQMNNIGMTAECQGLYHPQILKLIKI